mgnify:CR=1 FL=1
MATTRRDTTLDLAERALAGPRARDDFFAAVRLLERYLRTVPVGGDGPPALEPVRFRTVQSLAFPGRALERVQRREPGGARTAPAFQMEVAFMGLTGPSGVLPQHYTTLVQERLKQRDRALADFLDLFNHRLIALYYRACGKYRLVPQFERHDPATLSDPFSRALQALAGQIRQRPYQPQLFYAGHFSRGTRSSSALARLLSDFLGHPVRVECFVGQWLYLAEQDRLRIGSGGNGRNHRLGNGVLLGRRAWDAQSLFRIEIGPLTHAEHERLLPHTPRAQELRRLIDAYTPSHLNVELRFVIEDDAHRRRRLGDGLRLGWNAWLQSRPLRRRTATLPLRSVPPAA